MIAEESTLADVCFAVAATLDAHGISSILTGGSAAAIYAPHAYMSHDADFILANDEPLDQVASALDSIGYRREGRSRIFFHANSEFTVDFPKGPLAVGGDYVSETHVLKRGALRLRILTRVDCVRDRLSHFYFWSDYTALNAAVAVAAQQITDSDMDNLRTWTERESPALLDKFAEFQRRLIEKSTQRNHNV
ncbi:MAG: hypothetical protein M3126_04915 [Candidatus Eremiobacteraeota bacterium]|nr:hypothetical protein [Candidatus Eremiobacteraeota bacterium]